MKVLPEFISNNKLNKVGFWVAFLLGAALVFIQVNQRQEFTKNRAYDSDARANVHNIFLACNAYWADNDPENNCTPAIASGPEYGYIQSPDVNVIANGTKTDFSATAQHIKSMKTFRIDSNGTITP